MIEAAFTKFADALRAQDVDAFRSLCVDDAPPQDALFLRNAKKLADAELTVRLKRVDQQEDAAEVTFDVVDAAGNARDHGSVTFTRERDGWRIRKL